MTSSVRIGCAMDPPVKNERTAWLCRGSRFANMTVGPAPGGGAQQTQPVEADEDGGTFMLGDAQRQRQVADEVPQRVAARRTHR